MPDRSLSTPWGAYRTTESGLLLRDTTIANASSTRHGLMPKLSGSVNDVLRGDGTFGSVGSATLPEWLANDPNNAPSSPHADNDEFAVSPLDGDWSTATTGSPTYNVHTTFASQLAVKLSGGTTDRLTFTRAFAPGASTAFSWSARFHGMPQSGSAAITLRIRDAGSNNFVLLAFGINTGLQVSTHTIDGGGLNLNQGNSGVVGPTSIILHIERNASNVWETWFGDMQGMTRIWTGTKTWTVSHMELDFNANGSSLKQRLSCDWARRDWVTLA